MKKVLIILTVVILLSSCGSNGYCIQSEWAHPLSKQYNQNKR